MGFHSWQCNGCGRSMLPVAATNEKNRWHSEVVVFESLNGTELHGIYDGYGRVICSGGVATILNEPDWAYDGSIREPCCWHRSCWRIAGEPLEYLESKRSDDQGWFFDDTDYDHENPYRCIGYSPEPTNQEEA